MAEGMFPKPRAKGSAYREPEPKLVAPEGSTQATTRVVQRAEPPKDEGAKGANKVTAEEARMLLTPAGDERAFWAKQQFAARHPRITGAVLMALAAFIGFPSVATRLEGHHYGGRNGAFGGVFFMAGAWLLGAAMPLEPSGRPPPWWATGLTACCVVGAVVGIFIL